MKAKQSVYQSLAIASLFEVRKEVQFRLNPLERGDKGALNRCAPLTHQVANIEGKSPVLVRRYLRELQAEGHVMSDSHPGWATRWWPTGFADDLNAAKSVDGGVTYYEMPELRVVA